ncbi:MAG: winged helix-turn-helix transcriptional regulator [Solirubrobacteraceae bacterium]
MPHRPYDAENCSIARALAVVGERWSLLVMREVLLGARHFAEIKRSLGVAPNILSDRLATLVEHGLLERRGQEYVPTQKGIDINPVLIALMNWGDAYAAPAGPPRVVVHRACGHDAHPELTCAHCGETLDPGDTYVRPGPGALSGTA